MGFCVGAEAKEDMRIHLGAALHPADITGQDGSTGAVRGTWILQLTTRPWRQFKRTSYLTRFSQKHFFFFGEKFLKNVTEVQIHSKLSVCVCADLNVSTHTFFRQESLLTNCCVL